MPLSNSSISDIKTIILLIDDEINFMLSDRENYLDSIYLKNMLKARENLVDAALYIKHYNNSPNNPRKSRI